MGKGGGRRMGLQDLPGAGAAKGPEELPGG